jgi:hypothetical protein
MLLPCASCSLKYMLSASARIGPGQPFRISRYMLSISMHYLSARGTSHQACGSFESSMYLFADHQFSFPLRASAATHQLNRPKRNHAICFDR